MGYKAKFFRIQGAVFFFCLQVLVTAAVAEECAMKAGKLASMQGEAQVLHKGKTLWRPAAMDEALCAGDMLRVGVGGRAAVVLANETVIRIDQESTLSFGESIDEGFSLLKLLNGVLHIFSHRPRALKILTPYVNGAVEGTEFLVRVGSGTSQITVFEGLVVATNAHGHLQVASGQTVVADKGRAPSYLTVVRPRDAVQWTLYYPSIFDGAEKGRENRHELRIRQAAKELSSGRVEAARKVIAEVLEQDPAESQALALLAIIEVVQNNKEKALQLAGQGLAASLRSAAAALALSYAQQANFDISAALATLIKAEELHPDNAEIKARLAELQLSVGDLDKAAATAAKAVRLDPNIGRSQTVLGFACLTRVETDQAQAAFRKAIHLDPALPLARLGLGLALIREGRLAEGRAEIELAAALDPGNALIRSYLGKAYYEEKRDSQAQRQYKIAKDLDPSDPTPWFYDALRKQSLNRPVEALQDLQKSIELNDNRAVYRSRLLLDEDLAVRSASLGRIYDNLGFQQLALVEGWKSIQTDPTNYSAHRFLADSYSALPRHEIARVSELLQSQLLQPVNSAPVQPLLVENNLYIQEGAGPSSLSLNEYNPLFQQNKISLRSSGVVGGNETLGDEVVMSGIQDNFSYSLGQFRYQSEGYRLNNDQESDIFNAYAQQRISVDTSIFMEVRHTEREYGDLLLLFDPDQFSDNKRQEVLKNTYRLGFHHNFSPNSEVIGTIADQNYDENFDVNFGVLQYAQLEEVQGDIAEMQHLYRNDILNVVTGLGYYDGEVKEKDQMTFTSSMVSLNPTTETEENSYISSYIYSRISLYRDMNVTFGSSYDAFDNGDSIKEQFNPKVGAVWSLLPSTTIRAAAFRVMSKKLILKQTIEPTYVAGFNQFFDDAAGTGSWVYGGAVDQKFRENLFGGIEIYSRRLEMPYEQETHSETASVSEAKEADWREDSTRMYLYWTPYQWLTTGIELFHEKIDRNEGESGVEGIEEVRTDKLRLSSNFFNHSGVFVKLQASYIDQVGDFVDSLDSSSFHGDDKFWIIDAGLGYRLPKHRGFVLLEAKNLFDEKFQFQDTDPENPKISPAQLIIFKLTFLF
jgi:tetratricopeptide (TPR) repeat protein